MDFGDILKKWENKQTGKNNQMEEWLRDNEVYDKDANAKKTQKPGLHKQRLMRLEPEGTLDIHGLTNEEAWLSLERFFSNAKDCGYDKLRIIHGKGNHSQGEAVLKNTVRKFIEQCSFAGESGYEKAINGGTGATWVFLKH